jgi:metal-responsive CopG/Arc/MetJ family transcriptional regulator
MAKSNVETEKVNLRVNSDLLAEVDETWKEEGFNSRSEFIRQTLRDAVDEPDVSAAALQRLLVSAEQARRDEFVDSDEIREEFLDE